MTLVVNTSNDAGELYTIAHGGRSLTLGRQSGYGNARALARAVDAKDPTTQRHSERVARLAQQLASEVGWSPEAAAALHEAGLVHDVGKIALPDSILFKPGPLTRDERRHMEDHCELGARMVSGILNDEQVEWVRGHHERLDGSGYPQGLVGDAIPEGARLLALADAWDAMTSHRAYQAPVSDEVALARCRQASGTQFWPVAIDALERLIRAGSVDGRAPADATVAA